MSLSGGHSLEFMFRSVGDRGRSKKWKEMLRLPPVAQCLCLRDEIGEWEEEDSWAFSITHGFKFSLV